MGWRGGITLALVSVTRLGLWCKGVSVARYRPCRGFVSCYLSFPPICVYPRPYVFGQGLKGNDKGHMLKERLVIGYPKCKGG